jgi:predicted DNA-binding transcriptional regulator AlpA
LKIQHPDFPSSGFVRLRSIIAPHGPIAISRSAWYERVKRGEFPRPIKLGQISLWRAEDILALVERIATGGNQ